MGSETGRTWGKPVGQFQFSSFHHAGLGDGNRRRVSLGWHYPGKDWQVPVGAIDTTKAKTRRKVAGETNSKVSHLFPTRNMSQFSQFLEYRGRVLTQLMSRGRGCD